MEIYADLHIHTALSPCGDRDMTPNNIVNMSKLKGLGAIAITDHNSCENVEACMEAASGTGLIVIPGMELQTREEIHVVCLFNSLKSCLAFQEYVYKHLPNLENRPDIFGEQIIFDSNDNIIGYNERMLLSSANISFDDAYDTVKKLNGIFIPAHVDRSSYSVLYSLGFIPDYLNIKILEYDSLERIKLLIDKELISSKYKYIRSSDAHYLYQIHEMEEAIKIHSLPSNNDIQSIMRQLEL